MRARTGWIWTPCQYVWTPGGYAYIDGYWDYPLYNRGLLFAPVYFDQPYWQTAGWYYRPWYTVGFRGLLASLFVHPYWSSYYFGDYYDPHYRNLGFYPWYSYGYRYYDPIFSYYYWRHHDDAHWYNNLRDTYVGRRNGTLARSGPAVAPINRFESRNVQLTRANPKDYVRSAEQIRAKSAARANVERTGRALPPGRVDAEAARRAPARSRTPPVAHQFSGSEFTRNQERFNTRPVTANHAGTNRAPDRAVPGGLQNTRERNFNPPRNPAPQRTHSPPRSPSPPRAPARSYGAPPPPRAPSPPRSSGGGHAPAPHPSGNGHGDGGHGGGGHNEGHKK
jgi:hypothetical protein